MLDFKFLIIIFLVCIFLFLYVFYKIFIKNNFIFKIFLKSKKINKIKQQKKNKQQKKENKENILINELFSSLGGLKNIQDVKNNAMRLRVTLRDVNLINNNFLKKNKIISGVITKKNIYQLIINGNNDLVKKIKNIIEEEKNK